MKTSKQVVIKLDFGSTFQEEMHLNMLVMYLEVLRTSMTTKMEGLGFASHKDNDLNYAIVEYKDKPTNQ